MTADDRLTQVFERGFRNGLEALDSPDRELFRIQDFILEYEIGGLSGYLYNRLPDLDCIRTTVEAMSRRGLVELAAILGEATELFADYRDPGSTSTWAEVLSRYDPMGRIDRLQGAIGELQNYGLSAASIE